MRFEVGQEIKRLNLKRNKYVVFERFEKDGKNYYSTVPKDYYEHYGEELEPNPKDTYPEEMLEVPEYNAKDVDLETLLSKMHYYDQVKIMAFDNINNFIDDYYNHAQRIMESEWYPKYRFWKVIRIEQSKDDLSYPIVYIKDSVEHKEMTQEQIEKKLGHKIKIKNEERK